MVDILHPSMLDLEALMDVQRKVAGRVIRRDDFEKLERVCGCDVSAERDGSAWAACVVVDRRSLSVLESRVARVKLRFPYIPTFLAFRELEAMLGVAGKVEADVYIVGAHGVAHPRRAGLASHLGVALDKPSFGVAKSLVCGECGEPPNRRGAYLHVRDGGEIIGAALRTVRGAKPVYVSVGHRVSLRTSIRLTVQTSKYRIPEPLRMAHNLAKKASLSQVF
ncbi:MAG: endonuclease V [Candidatus Hadarchaeales archaeon]